VRCIVKGAPTCLTVTHTWGVPTEIAGFEHPQDALPNRIGNVGRFHGVIQLRAGESSDIL
jgi:hypothetical protein